MNASLLKPGDHLGEVAYFWGELGERLNCENLEK